jgi:hypothetical protein
MQHHQIASLTRSTALMACVAALMLALAGSAAAKPDVAPQLSERGGEQSQPQAPQQLGEHSGEQSQPQAPQQLGEHSGEQSQAPAVTNPRVGDTPSDRVSPTAAPPATQSGTSTSSDGDGDGNAPLIVGLSLLTAALLGSGTYVVRRRRHVAPGH